MAIFAPALCQQSGWWPSPVLYAISWAFNSAVFSIITTVAGNYYPVIVLYAHMHKHQFTEKLELLQTFFSHKKTTNLQNIKNDELPFNRNKKKKKKDYQHSLLEAYFHQLCLQIVNTGNKLYTWGNVQIFVAKKDWGYSANHWKGRTQQTQLWYKQQMNIHKSIDKMQLPNCVVCIFCAHTQDAVTNIYSKHCFCTHKHPLLQTTCIHCDAHTN